MLKVIERVLVPITHDKIDIISMQFDFMLGHGNINVIFILLKKGSTYLRKKMSTLK